MAVTSTDSGVIHVVAGVITNGEGRVLIAKRPRGVHQGGLWEFPGGKLEPGEPLQQGLFRELDEELGIQVTASRPLIRIRHDYGERRVLLDIHRVLSYRGHPHGREGQALHWQLPDEMDPAVFPAADRPVISALRLPDRYLITGAEPGRADAFLARLEQVLERTGLRMVQLRAPQLASADYSSLADRCAALCTRARVKLILNCAPDIAAALPGDGLHLTEARLMALMKRPRIDKPLIGASCHDADTLAKAAALGLDYALLSPVHRTATHPDARPLGWGAFAALVDQASLPVYALGGVQDHDLDRAIAHGAQGIAGIRGYWEPSGSTIRSGP